MKGYAIFMISGEYVEGEGGFGEGIVEISR